MIPERIDRNTPQREREGHEFRYTLASGYVWRWDIVLDAACGDGYGYGYLVGDYSTYVGVDKELPGVNLGAGFVKADLQFWDPDLEFHVAVSFETIEHLPEYKHFIGVLKRAKRTIIVSVPVVPTVGINPWHVHDFAPGEMVGLFEDDDWRLYQMVQQPSESSEIYVFCRR